MSPRCPTCNRLLIGSRERHYYNLRALYCPLCAKLYMWNTHARVWQELLDEDETETAYQEVPFGFQGRIK
jgi:hypothetical protein